MGRLPLPLEIDKQDSEVIGQADRRFPEKAAPCRACTANIGIPTLVDIAIRLDCYAQWIISRKPVSNSTKYHHLTPACTDLRHGAFYV